MSQQLSPPTDSAHVHHVNLHAHELKDKVLAAECNDNHHTSSP